MATNNSDSTVVCDQCGSDFDRIGTHWSRGSCDFPDISVEKMDILAGCLMGDGCLKNPRGRKPSIRVTNTNLEFLEWLDEKLGWLSAGVRKVRDVGEEFSEIDGKKVIARKEQYVLRTRNHPNLETFVGWYESGKKVFPDDIEMKPMTLKMWFVCDGNKDIHGRMVNPRFRIRAENESENRKKILSMFSECDLPEPDGSGGSFCWSTENSKDMWEHIGDPIPGFEYKWPDDW